MVTFEQVRKKPAPDEKRTVDSREWFDSAGKAEVGSIELPEPNEDYFYAATRALSFWPVVNSRGATYEKEDFDDSNLGSLLGVQTNLEHDKMKVFGSIVSYNITDNGIDVGFRGDREQANAHGFDVQDMKPGNDFSQASVELTKDINQNQFYVYDADGTIKHKMSVPEGRAMGLRRTTENDPYLYQGMKVAERIKPLRFTGLGLVPTPADKTARLFKVAAGASSEEVPHNENAASAVISKENTMSDAEIQALNDKVRDLEVAVRTLTSEKEAASAEVTTVRGELETKIASLTAELASAVTERDALKSEKETAAKATRIEALVTELAAIFAPADDAAKVALQEKASSIVDDEVAIRLEKAERTAAAATAKVEALERAAAETPEAKAKREADEKAAAEKEKKEQFNAEPPTTSIAPMYVSTVNGKVGSVASAEDLLKNF